MTIRPSPRRRASSTSSSITLGWRFTGGNYHYKDASGGPGERARYETGFAQRAAIKRLTNNGTQFAQNALLAARAGRAGLASLTTDAYSSGGPTLTTLFLEAAQSGVVEELRRSKQIKLSQLAMLGSWCYSRAAILGMLVESQPMPFIALVWDPARAEKFWEFAKDEVDRIDALILEKSAGLGYVRMLTGYPELYGQDAMASAGSGDTKAIEPLASSKQPLNQASFRLSMDIAAGLGTGLQRPEFVRERLEAEANPDPERWALMHKAGLEIPSEPDPMSADEQIFMVNEVCKVFFKEYYPEAHEAFVSVTE